MKANEDLKWTKTFRFDEPYKKTAEEWTRDRQDKYGLLIEMISVLLGYTANENC